MTVHSHNDKRMKNFSAFVIGEAENVFISCEGGKSKICLGKVSFRGFSVASLLLNLIYFSH
jgi:hypothetical protein